MESVHRRVAQGPQDENYWLVLPEHAFGRLAGRFNGDLTRALKWTTTEFEVSNRSSEVIDAEFRTLLSYIPRCIWSKPSGKGFSYIGLNLTTIRESEPGSRCCILSGRGFFQGVFSTPESRTLAQMHDPIAQKCSGVLLARPAPNLRGTADQSGGTALWR